MATSTINGDQKVILDTPITIAEDALDHTVIALSPNHTYRIDFQSYIGSGYQTQSIVASFGNVNTTTVIYNRIYTNVIMRMLIMGQNWNIGKIDGTSTGYNIIIQKITQID